MQHPRSPSATSSTTYITTTHHRAHICRCQARRPVRALRVCPPGCALTTRASRTIIGSLPSTSRRSRYTCASGRGADIRHGQQAQAQTYLWYLKGTADSYVRRPTPAPPTTTPTPAPPATPAHSGNTGPHTNSATTQQPPTASTSTSTSTIIRDRQHQHQHQYHHQGMQQCSVREGPQKRRSPLNGMLANFSRGPGASLATERGLWARSS